MFQIVGYIIICMNKRGYLYRLASGSGKDGCAGVVTFFLWALSLLYSCIVRVLASVKSLSRFSPPVAVISVGNLTVGGTGKTPMVQYIARCLHERGRRVVIVTRGYGKNRIHAGRGALAAMGDEPFMLANSLPGVPVIIEPRRALGITEAFKRYNADLVILDDGFQQWGIRKDLDIVMIDGANGFGNGYVLPRGLLREPLSALRRADVCVVLDPDPEVFTKVTSVVKLYNPSAEVITGSKEVRDLAALGKADTAADAGTLKGKPIALACAIGDPGSFRRTALAAGWNVVREFSYPDHYVYCSADVEAIVSAMRGEGISVLLVTEKDAAKLAFADGMFGDINVFVVRITVKLGDSGHGFIDRLVRLRAV